MSGFQCPVNDLLALGRIHLVKKPIRLTILVLIIRNIDIHYLNDQTIFAGWLKLEYFMAGR